MRNTYFLFRALIFALLVCSCSIEIDQTNVVPTLVSTPPVIASAPIFPVTQAPVTWAHLNLTGKLVYLSSMTEGDKIASQVQMLDLATGNIATIFTASPAWVYYATVSPDSKTLLISYYPPRESNSSSRSLYVIPLESPAEPQPLFTPPASSDRYTQVEWSPDGKFIYYVHYNQEQREGQLLEDYDISQMTYPEGGHKKILEHAFWPRVSLDSSRLVYVSLDPDSGQNELFVANADGSGPQRVSMSGTQAPEIIDAPIFSPDRQSILFSAPVPAQSYSPNFVDRLMGIQVVQAHNVPSDWWSVPVTGGVPTRLTNIQTINLFASLSPDHQHIASLSGEGIVVMDLDGSNLTQLLSDPGVHGTISWIP